MTLTLEPVRDSSFAAELTPKQVADARHEACLATLDSMDDLLSAWQHEKYLKAALLFEEFGKQNGGAHLQTSWTALTTCTEDDKACKELEKKLRPHMRLPQHCANGKVSWRGEWSAKRRGAGHAHHAPGLLNFARLTC